PAPEPAPKPRGCWYFLKGIFWTVYLAFGTALSLFLVSFGSVGGVPVSSCLPDDAAIMLRVRSADALWHGLENDPRVQALWQDEDVQAGTGLGARWKKLEQKWRELPRILRGRRELGRESLAFFTAGEASVALVAPPPDGKPPVYLFFRLSGGAGAAVRFFLWINAKQEPERFHDLGGGMFAITDNGATLSPPRPRPPQAPLPEDAVAEFALRPFALLKITFPQPKSFPPPPPYSQILCVDAAPESVEFVVRAPGDGTVALDGQWHGPLPAYSAPAPLLQAEGAPAQPPLLEAELPFGVRAAFLNWLDHEMQVQPNGNDKEKRRWENRLLELEKQDVDLNRDLWPACGSRLKLAVLPPNEDAGEKIARVSLSLPFTPSPAATKAVVEFARVRWDGVAEGRAPAPEDWKTYVRKFSANGSDRFLLVKKNPPIPLIVLGPEALGGVSDAGPLAPMWGAPELAFPKAPAAPAPESPLMYLRVDGPRLAPQAAAFRQSQLEDTRDEMGAAKFMDKYPDEQQEIRFAEKVTRFLGEFQIELRRSPEKGAKPAGLLSGRWKPDFPSGPKPNAPAPAAAPPAP
ncbi:MAG: hypothetical protein KIS92_22680, partial [Planctomycetota bacterium]|nr:hypothetical protein [Planctomycetota bacterium]